MVILRNAVRSYKTWWGMYSMNDNLSIHEFSKLTGVDATTLRYWDSIGVFSPSKRDPDNNYRYYSVVQIPALNFVTTLSDLEIPLKTIAKLRQERNPEELLNLLEKQEKKMDMEMRNLRQRYSIIHARRELINFGVKVDENVISVEYREDKAMFIWTRNEYGKGDSFIEPLAAKIADAGNQNINFSFPVGGYHDDMESFIKAPGHPDHFVSIDPLGNHTRKAGNYLVGFARGYYGQLGDLPERMRAYAEQKSVAVSGPVYTIYLREEICTRDASQYLAQCCVAVDNTLLAKKRGR